MKKTIIFILVLTLLLSGNAAYAEDNIFNLGAFPLKTSRTVIHYMMENLSASNPEIFEAEIPWSTGVSKYNSETYTLPLRRGQIFKYKDTILDIKTAGESFSFICNYFDSNDQVNSVEIACELDAKYLEKMEVKSLFFDNYKSLGLTRDPSVKGRLEDKYYSASETIDGIVISMSVNVLHFRLTFSLA